MSQQQVADRVGAPQAIGDAGLFQATPLLLDVTPHSLGVETAGGFVEHVIRKNAVIPIQHRKVFYTAQDDQTSVSFRVSQGEKREIEGNQILGLIELTGIRPAARGEVAISVTFALDENGILNVHAKDEETGKEQKIRIELIGRDGSGYNFRIA